MVVFGEYIQIGRLMYYTWTILPIHKIEEDEHCKHLFGSFYWKLK